MIGRGRSILLNGLEYGSESGSVEGDTADV